MADEATKRVFLGNIVVVSFNKGKSASDKPELAVHVQCPDALSLWSRLTLCAKVLFGKKTVWSSIRLSYNDINELSKVISLYRIIKKLRDARAKHGS